MDLIGKFDPWNDPLCTCPRKYTLNPYTGCAHSCIYCYISSYIPRAFECRPKKDLISRIRRDLSEIDKRRIIGMSNSSDPYPPEEARLGLTRACLELFSREGCRVQMITKSDLVERDVDLLGKMPSVVSFTITTLDEGLARKLEPKAPSPRRRLKAMKGISLAGVPTTLRLDPIFPFINEREIPRIVRAAARSGAVHVTASTFKPRPDSWRRMQRVFPSVAGRMGSLYFEKGSRHRRSWYLPVGLRSELLGRAKDACDELGLTFASCREGLRHMSTGATCDGSHLIIPRKPDENPSQNKPPSNTRLFLSTV